MELPEGRGGPFCKADFGKSRGEGGHEQNPFRGGGGLDMVWNYTFLLVINNQFSILVI